jgi:hypothetical protein
MFKAIKEFFFGKPQTAAPAVPDAPYKVEAPAFKPTADAAPVETKAVPAVKKSAAPRAKKTATATKAPIKKPTAPRMPRAPKA